MDRLSVAEQLEDLRTISGTVDDFLIRGLTTADTGVDGENNPAHTLAECYGIIIDELQEFGISFYEDESDLLADWYTAKHIYYIRSFVDSDNLLRILSVRGNLPELSALLQDDDLDLADLFQTVVEFIFQRETSEIRQILTDFSDRIRINDRFIAHLLACIKRIEETGSQYNISPEELPLVQRYIVKVQKDRQVVTEAWKYLAGTLTFAKYVNTSDAKYLVRTYDLDKTSPEYIRQFATLDRDDTLDPVGRQELLDHHHLTTPFHVEYYLNNHEDELDETHLIFVFLALIEPEKDVRDFIQKARETAQVLSKITQPRGMEDFVNELIETLIRFHTGEEDED